jgi:hypothetical protein
MTPKQMYRAMRKWGISVVFCTLDGCWRAGECTTRVVDVYFVCDANPAVAGREHLGTTPEMAVEDYCNARNLEWDV